MYSKERGRSSSFEKYKFVSSSDQKSQQFEILYLSMF